ncbi:hypothetical protein J7E50_14095 [Pedobacter sp. ISL-68]|uniref:hypothetical protein n=1 Tax=Pedobacter sp. ISL-68 TaxID=2819165 RepID=UPI001BE80786|nr:hypothetical protein [Pedobacter sp. ISL-68]MBT2591358.1 hypothetical protein [Pedobacter sp. ISL-68]
MEKKVKTPRNSDIDKVLAKVASVSFKNPKTQEPLAEKDELKEQKKAYEKAR